MSYTCLISRRVPPIGFVFSASFLPTRQRGGNERIDLRSWAADGHVMVAVTGDQHAWPGRRFAFGCVFGCFFRRSFLNRGREVMT